MKKTMRFVRLVAVTGTMMFMAASAAVGQQSPGDNPKADTPAKEMPQHHQNMMDISAMMQEPPHLLAMAYRDNLVCFASLLREQAAVGTTVDGNLARATVAEMKRSVDQMQSYHQEHMKTMTAEMKRQLAETIKHHEAQLVALRADLRSLEREARISAPDSKRISDLVGNVLQRCDDKSAMKSARKFAKSTS